MTRENLSMMNDIGSAHFHITQAADGVYAAVANPGTGSVGNASIINMGEHTLVVDTFSSVEAAEDLKAAAETLTGNPVAYVVNTHWHSDHTTGNQVFASSAQLISSTGTYDWMATFCTERISRQRSSSEIILQQLDELLIQAQHESNKKLQQELLWEIASDRVYMNGLPNLSYTLPTLSFNHRMCIHGNKRTVELITYGGGHTQSDTFVYLPQERIAIMGDLVLSNHHPVLNNANPRAWLSILEQVEQLDLDTIVPGHGEVCTIQALHEVKSYIRDLFGIIQEAQASGTNLDDIPVPEKYRDWYFTTYFRSNLHKIHEFLITSAV